MEHTIYFSCLEVIILKVCLYLLFSCQTYVHHLVASERAYILQL